VNIRHDMISVFVARPDALETSHEFLQLHRAAGDYMGGTWAIVRGGVNAGESYVAAALRELREETGLSPLEFYRAGTIESFYVAVEDTIWHSPAFLAVVTRGDEVVLNDEHDVFRWTPRADIDAQTIWASERCVLADLCRDILDADPAKAYLRIPLHGL